MAAARQSWRHLGWLVVIAGTAPVVYQLWRMSFYALPYPLTAKYHMNLCGIPTENIARNRKSEELTEYGRSCMRQMKLATDALEKYLGI